MYKINFSCHSNSRSN